MTESNKRKLFNVLNSHFDKVFVLSLKRSTDRQERVKKTLKGLNFDFFWGVDGRELNFDKMIQEGSYHPSFTKLFKKIKGEEVKNLTLPQIACSMAHRNILKEMIKKSYENVLIFEDDILIQGNHVDRIEAALSELPNDWDLLYLGHHGSNSDPTLLLRVQIYLVQIFARLTHKFERMRVMNHKTLGRNIPRTYSDHLNLSGYHHGGYAYAVSYKGAEKILSYTWPTIFRNDNLFAELTTHGWLNSFNAKEIVFFPNREIPSTINDDNYQTTFK